MIECENDRIQYKQIEMLLYFNLRPYTTHKQTIQYNTKIRQNEL